MSTASGYWTQLIPYDSNEYREWNAERMRRYRQESTIYNHRQYIGKRIRDLLEQRQRTQAALDDNRREQ